MSKQSQLFNQARTPVFQQKSSIGRTALVIGLILLAIVAFVFAINYFAPREQTITAQYPHGIVAVISYNAYLGYPVVDSSYTLAQLLDDPCIININFDLREADSDARAYLAFSVFQMDPERGESWIRAHDSLEAVTMPLGTI
ncbi:MAG: hypothetical protein HZC01_03060 [Candidatus Kerfeldbacteria bacterium]|nr:hypothetical protein [Candidatus Kerfeldbacteria bacterium]